MAFTGHENHQISFTLAAEYTARYRETIEDTECKGGYFGKDAIKALLDQTGCVGIRYYYGLNSSDEKVLVLVGVDANENDLVGSTNLCMDMSTPCPSICGEDNMLNS